MSEAIYDSTKLSKEKLAKYYIVSYTRKYNGTSCWIWHGGTGRGYGIIRVNSKKQIGAHVYSYILFKGNLPENTEIDHLCKNKLCVNPEHLEAVTHKVNVERGSSEIGRNSKKTHCPKGHEYTAENTLTISGKRYCRACCNSRRKIYHAFAKIQRYSKQCSPK